MVRLPGSRIWDEYGYYLRNYRSLRKGIIAGDLLYPTLIQVQIISRCNGRCIMCPYGTSAAATNPVEWMDLGLFCKLADEIATWPRSVGKRGVLVLTFQNEPFLDKRIETFIEEWRKRVGNGWLVEITSNGTACDEERLASLARHPPDILNVSVNALNPATYAQIMPGFELATVEKFVRSAKRLLPRTRIYLRFIKQNLNFAEYRSFKHKWNREGFSVVGIECNDRLGAVNDFDSVKVSMSQPVRRIVRRLLAEKLFPSCPFPFAQANILCDGRVVMCCNDYAWKSVMGTIADSPLLTIYNGPKYKGIRNAFHRKTVRGMCSECSMYTQSLWL